MVSHKLSCHPYKGSFLQVGKEYGRDFLPQLRGFLTLEAKPTPRRLAFAKKCLPFVERYTPKFFRFVNGVVKTSDLSLEETILLSLHEEIVHSKNCTAVMSCERERLNGQNWDWHPQLYPWPSILNMNFSGGRHVLTYHYPGLYTCCGLNDSGFSLMWTGAGYYPRVEPKPGVPTYALLFEIFQKRSVKEVVKYLEKTPNAGCFIFFMMDRQRNGVVCEGIPHKVAFDTGKNTFFRANHYEIPSIVGACQQKRQPKHRTNSQARWERMQELLSIHHVNPRTMKQMLTDRPEIYKCRKNSATIDSVFVDSHKLTMWAARGGVKEPVWVSYHL